MRQKGFAHLVLIVIVGVIVAGGFIAYQKGYLKMNSGGVNPVETVTNTPTTRPTAVPTIGPTTSWETYTNTDLGISYEYPNTWAHNASPPRDDPYSTSVFSGGMYFINEGIIDWTVYENPKNLSLPDLDKEIYKKEQENMVGIGTGALAPKDYEVIKLKSGTEAYYEKEEFCEPTICQEYTIVRPGKVFIVIIFSDDKNQYGEGIKHFLDTLKFTK